MAPTFRYRMQTLKATVLQEQLESWQTVPVVLPQASDWEDVVAACVEVPGEMALLWQQAQHAAVKNPALLESGEPWVRVQQLFRAYLQVLPAVRDVADQLAAQGFPIAQRDAVDRAIRQLQQLEYDIFQGFDVAHVWQGEAEAARGESQPLEAVFARLALRG